MKNYMTVKEMIETLKKYDENWLVAVDGGEGANGSWGTLSICEDLDDVIWQNGEIILESED